MTAEILSLDGMDEDDEHYQAFLTELKGNTANAIFWVEKMDGTVQVGCNYTDRRDLVYSLHKISNLIQSILNQESDYCILAEKVLWGSSTKRLTIPLMWR